jgi:hypothetical protein
MRRLPTWREMHMDTSPEIEAMQFSFYRSAPTWRKLQMMSSLTRTARNLARLGLQDSYPNASDGELTQHLWDLLYPDLVRPDLARIDFPKAATQDNEMQEPELIDVALMVTTVLEELGVTYAIGGSVASTLHGVPRSTVDADLVADLQAEHIGPFVAALKEKFYADPLSVMDAILNQSSFNLIHLESMFKVDIFIPKHRNFDRDQLQRRILRTVTAQPPHSAWIASVEDTVLAKLEWFRLGGESSERQWRDVLGILKKQGEDIDTAYLRQQAADLNVADLLEQALVEAAHS